MARENIIPLLGDMAPSRTELRISIESSRDMGWYTLQEVSYNVEEAERISAFLLVPNSLDLSSGQKYPAIIACHQHGGRYEVGKSEPVGLCDEPANTFALTLCEAGYIVICPENIGFESRRERLADGTFMNGRENERWLFISYLLHGRTLLGKNIADLSHAVDVLEALEFVDRRKIGICGHSMGGLMALWAGWYDTRIAAIASSCGFSSLEVLQREHINHTFSMYLPSLLTHGDTPDLIPQICPRPLFLTFGRQDVIFPYMESERICAVAQDIYASHGVGGDCRAEVTDDGHIFTRAKQNQAVHFFNSVMASEG